MPLLKELSKEYTVYFTNLSGHGTEKTFKEFDEVIDVLEQKVRRLNLDNLVIIGHSLGGLCAYKLSQRFENIVTNVIMINSPLVKSRYSKSQLIWRFLIVKNVRGLILHLPLLSFYFRVRDFRGLKKRNIVSCFIKYFQ